MSRLLVLSTALVAACSSTTPSSTTAADDPPPPRADVLEWRLAGEVRGTGAQGVDRRRAAAAAGLDSGLSDAFDTGTTLDADPCTTTEATTVLSEADSGSWLLTSPVFDLRHNAGTDRVFRAAEVLSLSSTGCTRFASFGADSTAFETGFASVADPANNALVEPTGLMMRLVDVGDDLWVFSNSSRTWWVVDGTTGAISEGGTFDRPVAGAVADGAGGAWVSLSGIAAWPVGSGTDEVGAVVHLDSTGAASGVSWDLPWDPALTGFGSLTPDESGLEPHFLSNDLALDGDGTLWVLDSNNAQLAEIDAATGSTTTHDLGVLYPTGVAVVGGVVAVSGGLVSDGASLDQTPGLWKFDPTTGTTAALSLSEPAEGWGLGSGFVSLLEEPDSGMVRGSGVYLDRWLSLAPLGTGQLLVADPAYDRVLLVE